MIPLVKQAGVLAALFGVATAQFPPPVEGVKVLESKLGDGIKISYKEVSPLSTR